MMNENVTSQEALLFQAALGIQSPWMITNITLNQETHELHIYLDFEKGSQFPCPICNSICSCYDTQEKIWQHLSFFEYTTFLHARTPRVSCKKDGIHRIHVPWARSGSGFTLLMEIFLILLCKEATVKGVERITKVPDKRIWTILRHYVEEAVQNIDSSTITEIGIDETSRKKGHQYVTVAVDMKERKVFHVTQGKGKETCTSISTAILEQGGNPLQIQEISMDMSPSFIQGSKESFPLAAITFDKFHIMKAVNHALDEVRRVENKTNKELNKTRWLWLKNLNALTPTQNTQLKELLQNPYLKTAKAYALKLELQDFWHCCPKEAALVLLNWIDKVKKSQLEPLMQVADMIMRHWDGVLRWFQSRINNGVLEGINSIIQAAKRKARGYRSVENFTTMIYLLVGKINLDSVLHVFPHSK
jgi:transposase